MKITNNLTELKVGDKVVYTGKTHREPEKGIVKGFGRDHVYVVFNCGDNWEDFDQYTAAGCKPEHLELGWKD